MEKFFKISSSLDVVEVEELLLKRYSDINYILSLDFIEGYELINKAYEKFVEERLWDRWLIHYKSMTKDTFISFEDFKNQLLGNRDNIDTTSKEELLEMVKEIEKKSLTEKR